MQNAQNFAQMLVWVKITVLEAEQRDPTSGGCNMTTKGGGGWEGVKSCTN